jgi:hypothetical protein
MSNLKVRRLGSCSPHSHHHECSCESSFGVVDITHAKHRGEDEERLELEDKEIPPEKLTKLEKIGSGGFKE